MSYYLPRWHVAIIYQGETGPVVVDCDVEEVAHVHNLIERGPDWNAILDISIQLNRRDESVYLQSPIQKGEADG